MHYIIPSTQQYYVRSGYINLVNARFRNAGLNGYDWSGFARTVGWYTYYLLFHKTNVFPSEGNFRYHAFAGRNTGVVMINFMVGRLGN